MSMQFFTATAYEESVSAVTATPSVELGARRFWKGEEYVYCYNAGGASIAATLGVVIVTAASGYSVAATSLADTVNPCVGVVKHAAIAAGSYGWVMVKGFTTITTVSNVTADYWALSLGAAGKFYEPSVTNVAGTAAVHGFGLNTNTAAAGASYAFIKTCF